MTEQMTFPGPIIYNLTDIHPVSNAIARFPPEMSIHLYKVTVTQGDSSRCNKGTRSLGIICFSNR